MEAVVGKCCGCKKEHSSIGRYIKASHPWPNVKSQPSKSMVLWSLSIQASLVNGVSEGLLGRLIRKGTVKAMDAAGAERDEA